MKRLFEFIKNLFEKPLFKVVTERNKVKFIKAKNENKARHTMYQMLGSELFTIKEL